MLKPGPRVWTALLLFGGGVLLGILGFRHLALEREATDRRSRALEKRRLAEAVANAPRLARQPRSGPMLAWRLEPGRLPGTDEPLSAELTAAIAAARGPDIPPRKRFEAWKRLTGDKHPAWLRHIASYQAGVAALELDDPATASSLLEDAVEAQPWLVIDAVRVRAAALQRLALVGLRGGSTQALDRFLDEALDGRRLALGDVVGPADLVIELAQRVARAPLELPAKSATRLREADARARSGIDFLRKVPTRGDLAVVHVGQRAGFAHHTEIDLQVHDVAALVAPPEGFEARVHAATLHHDIEVKGPLSARLAAPFQSVVVTVDREPLQAKSLLALVGLALGLGLYVIGAVLALGGWRRSRIAARMQADFTAAVSHEMKTPIASVRAMAEMLQDADPERTQRYAGRIEMEMQRLGTTVRNVLDAARIERGAMPVHLASGDPAALVLRTAETLEADLRRRGYELEVEVVPAGGPLPIDADALDGVLRNLVDNAAKFSAPPAAIRLEAMPEANGYRVAVLDRGMGLESGKQDRLFERFYRGAAAREGAVPGVGLGLHIAREVIDAHGGSLAARNRTGGGAVFEIHLPAENAQ